MRAKIFQAAACATLLLGFADSAFAESQPTEGSFGVEFRIVKSEGCKDFFTDKEPMMSGVAYYPGPSSRGATLRLARNDGNPPAFIVFNNLPITPPAGASTWIGTHSGFVGSASPPLAFSGDLRATVTWIDANAYVMDLTISLNSNCLISPAFVNFWRTNLNQGPLF